MPTLAHQDRICALVDQVLSAEAVVDQRRREYEAAVERLHDAIGTRDEIQQQLALALRAAA